MTLSCQTLTLDSLQSMREDLEEDHSLVCDVARTVFQGFSKKNVQSTDKVTFPSINLNFVDDEWNYEWNRTLEDMPFKVKEAIVPLTGDKGKVYESLPLLIVTLKPRVEQEIKFEPLPDLPKLDLGPKGMKDRLQKLELSSISRSVLWVTQYTWKTTNKGEAIEISCCLPRHPNPPLKAKEVSKMFAHPM